VQGNVSNASGAALAPVLTPAQNIAAGASASFSFDVAVANPKLWSPDAPNLYQLATQVQVGGATVDDDLTTFGIRSLVYDATTGLSINGKATKFQGACLHQDYHGLGLAAPQRAMQRRLAQLKAYGVNAVRTAHDPPSPEFLDLCDRMGILVMDEFFDVWTGHKYTDVGDYATYFNKTATNPTGMPAVPGAATGAKWYEVDVTGIVMRDRNHPSVAMYSVGNEIRDSLATRTPLLTRMLAIVHALDPDRPVTQGLFRPLDSGDITGATRTLLDVFGGNYRSDEVLTAMSSAPARAGVLTEMGTETGTWSAVKANAALTGSFMWTGVDYLGESDGAWPTVGGTFGMLDAMGTPKSIAFSWQTTWGLPKTTFSTGAVAGKVVLTADHPSITTDLNDVAYVRATVPSATAAVTFAITGPGTILAVDSGSQTQESFRGNTRNAYGGIAYAIVQATGAGTITVTATSAGATDGTATLQTTEGRFVPCTGSCD
jgi:beta-galactosidase